MTDSLKLKLPLSKIFLTFLLVTHSLFADEGPQKIDSMTIEARLLFMGGDVQIRTSSSTYQTATPKQDLMEGDSLKTGHQSLAIVKLPDSSKFKLGPNSEIKIKTMVERINGQNFKETSLVLKTGKILINVLNTKSEPVLNIKTPNAAIGVRGTKFFAGFDEDITGDLYIASNHGELELTSASRVMAEDINDAMTAGYGMVVDNLGYFTQQKKYDWVKDINFDTDDENPIFGRFTERIKERKAELKAKREKWKPDRPLLQQKKRRWQEMAKRYRKKEKKFKYVRKLFRQHKRTFIKERKSYFKERSKILRDRKSLNQKIEDARGNKRFVKKLKERLDKLDQENSKFQAKGPRYLQLLKKIPTRLKKQKKSKGRKSKGDSDEEDDSEDDKLKLNKGIKGLRNPGDRLKRKKIKKKRKNR